LSHYQELLLYVIIYLPGSPIKKLSLEAVRTEPLQRERERHSIPRAPFIHLSKFLVDKPPFRFPNRAPMERDAHLKSLTYLSSRVPSKGTLPPGSLHRAPIE